MSDEKKTKTRTMDDSVLSRAKSSTGDSAIEKVDGYADAYNFLGSVVAVLLIAAKNGSSLEKKYARKFIEEALQRKELTEARAEVRRMLNGVL